ncbi:MAG: hypothetical protein P1P64_03005 [Treponemataceae bacterium]
MQYGNLLNEVYHSENLKDTWNYINDNYENFVSQAYSPTNDTIPP